jgi:V8-like Glu-specific endopeptidase
LIAFDPGAGRRENTPPLLAMWVNDAVRVIAGLLTGAAVSAFIGFATWLPASASPPGGLRSGPTAHSPSSGAHAATYVVSAAAQRSALAFWTPLRMAAASSTAAGHPTRAGASPDVQGGLIAPRGTPTAARFSGIATVGALFYTTGSKKHFCTASVIDSAARDVILTAAHCVFSTSYATNVAYVPEYHSGARPLGTWAVRAITVAAGWRTAHNPNLDFAFLATAPKGGKPVQAVTRGLALGFNSYGQTINVIGYNDSNDLPVRCLTRSFEFRPGQLEFYCHDYHGGTSGGPWITGLNPRTGTGVVHGVIGGYEQGGSYEWASYSAYFGAKIDALLKDALGLHDLGAVHFAERVGEQFKPGAVGVLEVDRGLARDVVFHSRGVELALQVIPLVLGHRDRYVVEVPERLPVRPQVKTGEVEERQQVSVADVEEEVARPRIVPVAEDLGQRELQQSLVELDRLLDIGADERGVVDTARRGSRAARRNVLRLQPCPLDLDRCQVNRRLTHSVSRSLRGALRGATFFPDPARLPPRSSSSFLGAPAQSSRHAPLTHS